MRQAGFGLMGWLQDLSIRKKLYLLVGILVLNLVTVISLSILGLSTLSQVRAYVGGEGLWAKAQKNAVYSLSKYAVSGRDKDYQDYLRHLRTPLGDRKARMELSKPEPDLAVSDQGFLDGQNHPEDVRGMAMLFRRFHRFELIAKAIRIWGEADAALLQLQQLGDGFHALSPARRRSPVAVADFISRLDALNDRLTGLENDFSFTMGEAARWAKRLLVWVMVLGSMSIGVLSVLIALYFSRAIVKGVTLIGEAASRAAEGDLSARVSLGTGDELGRLAEAFNAMTEGLARIDQLKNNFVSNVSHELRTPLTLNLAPLESMLSGEYGEIPEAQKAALGIMYNNAMRLLQMVNGLLDFSKLEAGKMPVLREACDLISLSDSVFNDFRPVMLAKGLDPRLKLPASLPLLMMDRYLFERILFNLLSNAVKFTPQGGSISLELSYEAGKLRLGVRDSGIGISEADAARLFQKFSQAEASSTRRFEGTGLGLAMVKECAQLLGGSAWLESKPGEGSLFAVECLAPEAPDGAKAALAEAPSRRQAAAAVLAAPPALAVGSEASSLPRLLVAEDNAELAAFINSLLSSSCQIRHASDGRQALEEARSWRPDLVLSDVMMPGMDGISLTQELKRAPETAAIPVILLTALTGQRDLLRGWEAGADDYLFKPFHPRELQARIRSMLSMVAWRRRSEEQRKRQEVLELFTRIASHDLKAPLRRIASYASLLVKDAEGKLSPEGLDYLKVISKGAAQMYALIESLIQYSRLDSGELAFRMTDLGILASEVLSFLDPAIREEQAVIELKALPSLSVVPGHIFALLQNLLSNSLKYRSPERAPRIELGAVRQGHHWLFSVADNGIGFDPAHKEAIFVIFKRLQEGGEIPGEGMGLAIAKKIVEIHGGRIWAESVPGQGCTVYFTLLTERGGPDGA